MPTQKKKGHKLQFKKEFPLEEILNDMRQKYGKINKSHMLTSMTIIDTKERWNCPNLDKLHATKEKKIR